MSWHICQDVHGSQTTRLGQVPPITVIFLESTQMCRHGQITFPWMRCPTLSLSQAWAAQSVVMKIRLLFLGRTNNNIVM